MKRQLLIMRHGKSSWANSQLMDHERALNKRGQRDAPAMGRLRERLELVPDYVILSDSQRTTETFEAMWPAMPKINPIYAPSLYLGNLRNIQTECADLSGSLGRVLVLGHNPGFSLAVTQLSGKPVELKTAYIAVLEVESDSWSALNDLGAWRLLHTLTPAQAHG